MLASLQYANVNFAIARECYVAKCNTLNYRLQIVQIIKIESVQIELNSKHYLHTSII